MDRTAFEGRKRGSDGKVTVTGANIVLFIFSGVFIIYQIIFTLIFGEDFFTENIYLSIVINEVVLILIPVLIYALIKKVDFRETFRFRRFKPIQAILIVALSVPAYFVASMINNIVYFLFQFIGDMPVQPIPVPDSPAEYLVGLLAVAVLPGICEEMMHRGLLLKAYERRGSMKAIIITAIFFGLFHFDLTNLLGPIFLGVLIGYYVIRTNSIFAGMLAHFMNNAIAETIQYLWGDRTNPEKIVISAGELGQVILLGCAGIIVTLALISVFKNLTAQTVRLNPPISSVKRDIASISSHWPVIGFMLLYFLMSLLFLLAIIIAKIMPGF